LKFIHVIEEQKLKLSPYSINTPLKEGKTNSRMRSGTLLPCMLHVLSIQYSETDIGGRSFSCEFLLRLITMQKSCPFILSLT